MAYFDDNVRALLFQSPHPKAAEALARELWTRADLVDAALGRLLEQGLVHREPDGRWTAHAARTDAGPGAQAQARAQAQAQAQAQKSAELDRLRRELQRLRTERDRLVTELHTARRQSSGAVPTGGSRSELGMHMDDLLVLCHPDRHDNSERSTRVTRWLLSRRRR